VSRSSQFVVDVVVVQACAVHTPACTLALPWPLWYLGACRMLSYPPHPAHQQQQATTPMSLAFQAQTQNHHQQQQQVKDEQSAEKAADNEQLQKPLKVRHHYVFAQLYLRFGV